MELWPSTFQAASLGGAAVLASHPDDGAHLTFYGIVFAGLCSIATTVINRRADRARDAERYRRDREEREFQATQISAALARGPAKKLEE